jgi:hypothetical protein
VFFEAIDRNDAKELLDEMDFFPLAQIPINLIELERSKNLMYKVNARKASHISILSAVNTFRIKYNHARLNSENKELNMNCL